MNDWNGPQQSLPRERDYVQFIVAGHRSLLTGVFTDHRFHSRLASYLPREVSVWRKLGGAPRRPAPERAPRERPYWSERPMREA